MIQSKCRIDGVFRFKGHHAECEDGRDHDQADRRAEHIGRDGSPDLFLRHDPLGHKAALSVLGVEDIHEEGRDRGDQQTGADHAAGMTVDGTAVEGLVIPYDNSKKDVKVFLYI